MERARSARSVWLCGKYMLVVGYFGGALAGESGHSLSTAAGVFSWMLKDMVRATLASFLRFSAARSFHLPFAARRGVLERGRVVVEEVRSDCVFGVRQQTAAREQAMAVVVSQVLEPRSSNEIEGPPACRTWYSAVRLRYPSLRARTRT